ncbi:MAG TPA: ABC transporter permease, partial [Prevotella sp.]
MAVTQHVLSSGHTHYDRSIGAVVITVVLYLIHVGMASWLKVRHLGFSLSFFPSLLLLGLITNVKVVSYEILSFDVSLWVYVLFIGVYVLLLQFYFQFRSLSEANSRYLFTRFVWVDLLMMFLMFLMVGTIS